MQTSEQTKLCKENEAARIAAIKAARGSMAHVGVSVDDLHRERQKDKKQEEAHQFLQRMMDMKESSTYQYILEEGAQQGELREARRMLLILGSKRFGEPDMQIQTAIDLIASPQHLEQLAGCLLEVESWQELLK